MDCSPNPMPTDSEIEIRQIFVTEEFDYAPEAVEQEKRLIAEMAARQKK